MGSGGTPNYVAEAAAVTGQTAANTPGKVVARGASGEVAVGQVVGTGAAGVQHALVNDWSNNNVLFVANANAAVGLGAINFGNVNLRERCAAGYGGDDVSYGIWQYAHYIETSGYLLGAFPNFNSASDLTQPPPRQIIVTTGTIDGTFQFYRRSEVHPNGHEYRFDLAADTAQARLEDFNARTGDVTWGDRAAGHTVTVEARNRRLLIAGRPVLGPTRPAIADATDAASAITQLNLLLAAARAHGQIAGGQTLYDGLAASWPMDEDVALPHGGSQAPASGNWYQREERYDRVGTSHLIEVGADPAGQVDTDWIVASGPGPGAMRAAVFPAGARWLQCSANAAIQTGDVDLTITVWVYFSALDGGFRRVLNKEGEYTIGTYGGGHLYFDVNSGAAAVDVTGLAAGAWYFFECYHDAANNILGARINNGSPTTLSYSGGMAANGNPLTVNGTASGTQRLIGGSRVAGLALHKRLLTDPERAALYNGGSGLPAPY